jgi:ubiquinol-cytochrome c reductase cytochrome c1 subunit
MMRFWHIILGVMVVAISYAVPIPDTSKARGAVWFMNYCAGCHRLKYLSWSRMMTDLALEPDAILDVAPLHLSVLDNPGNGGLSNEDAQHWFAKMPPELSKISQIRGNNWLKGYLLGFYSDPGRPYGVSNDKINQVMMPNVLFPVQQQMTRQHFTRVLCVGWSIQVAS